MLITTCLSHLSDWLRVMWLPSDLLSPSLLYSWSICQAYIDASMKKLPCYFWRHYCGGLCWYGNGGTWNWSRRCRAIPSFPLIFCPLCRWDWWHNKIRQVFIKHKKRSMVNGHASQQLQGEKWFSEQNFLPQKNLTETREKFSLKNFSHKNLGGLCQPLSWQQGEIFHPEMLKQLTSQRNTYWLNTPKDGK